MLKWYKLRWKTVDNSLKNNSGLRRKKLYKLDNIFEFFQYQNQWSQKLSYNPQIIVKLRMQPPLL